MSGDCNCTCPIAGSHDPDCAVYGPPQEPLGPWDWDGEPCEHDHDEECYDAAGNNVCLHEHCIHCGSCQCPGYCDDYQTYNLRPADDETVQNAQEA